MPYFISDGQFAFSVPPKQPLAISLQKKSALFNPPKRKLLSPGTRWSGESHEDANAAFIYSLLKPPSAKPHGSVSALPP